MSELGKVLELLRRPRVRAVLAALVLLAGGGTVAVTVDDGDPETPPHHFEIKVPAAVAPAGEISVDRDNTLEPAEAREADEGTEVDVEPDPHEPGIAVQTDPPAEVLTPDVHEDARDETPPGVTSEQAEQIVEGHTAGMGPPRPVGGAQNYSCRRHLVQNRSSRGGADVKLFVLHYTVSRPGSLDVIWRLFNTPSFGASSSLGLEPSGRCELWVPFSEKAWTQGAYNPVSESVEIMAMGTESKAWWKAQPIIRDGILASIVRDRLRANGLPLRRVNPSGCGVQAAGWTDHNALECGNSHHDVSPNFPYGLLEKQIREGSAVSDRSQLTSSERRAVRCVESKERIRERNGGFGKVAPRHREEWRACRDALHRANQRLHAAGLSTDRRRARHREIHRVL